MRKHQNNNACPNTKCDSIDSFELIDKMLKGKVIKCNECGKNWLPEVFYRHKYNIDNIIPANPRCPNVKCDFHKDAPPAKLGFVISVVEEGLMGKIFKSEAYGIVSCKLCGEVIGVGGKG